MRIFKQVACFRRLYIVSVGIWLAGATFVLAQNPQPTEFFDPISNKEVAFTSTLSSYVSTSQVQALTGTAALNIAKQVVSARGAELGLLSNRHEVSFEKPVVDSIGVAHVKGVQTVGSIPVFGSSLHVHINPKRNSVFVTAKLIEGAPNDKRASITADGASEVASDAWATTYGREPSVLVKPVLMIFDASLVGGMISGEPTLAYRLDVGDIERSERYFVDAHSGGVLDVLSLSTDLNRTVLDCSFGDGNCYNGSYYAPLNYYFGRREGQAKVGANPINIPPIQSYPYDTDNIYNGSLSFHYYLSQTFGRNGVNGFGGLGNGSYTPLDSMVSYSYADWKAGGSSCPNALFNPATGMALFCTGLATADIIAHEFAHGLTTYTADLIYRNESGALNESFSDIFGETTERFMLGTNDWLLGTNRYQSAITGISRNMADPEPAIWNPYYGTYSNGNQPAHFYSATYYCGPDDNGGVHTNSGVLNYAAYLISEGGSFNGCTVRALGMQKMEQVMFRALKNYLWSSATFNDAFLSIKQAAVDILSAEDSLEVEKALRAVELNQGGACTGIARQPTGCSAVVDQCPTIPNVIFEGPCGCGVEAVDQNGNGQADCLDPTKKTRPAPPLVERIGKKKKKGKNRFQVTLQAVPGAQYVVTIAPKRGRSITRKMRSHVVRVATKSGVWKISYRIKLKKITTKSSKKRKLK